MVCGLLRVEAENFNMIRFKAITGGEVIGDTIETGGFHFLGTVYGVRDVLHVDQGIGIEVQCSNEVIVGTDIKPYAQR